MNPQLAAGHYAQLPVSARDVNGIGRSLGSLTATIDDYVSAYVSAYSDSSGVSALVQPKVALPAGGTKTVNITFHATSMDGTALPPITVSLDLVGPPAPPQATQLVSSGVSIWGGNASTPDPGSPTATLI